MSRRIEYIIDEIMDQYMYADLTFRPWIIGFSGGKDSTVLLTLVWMALKKIKETKRFYHLENTMLTITIQ